VKASDPLEICLRNDNPPAFLISDKPPLMDGTNPIDAVLRLNDLLAGIVVDRNHNGFDGGELKNLPKCTDDGTTSDCRFLALCLDLNIESTMLLAGTDAEPSMMFNVGTVMPMERKEGVACEGDVDFKYTTDADAASETTGSDAVENTLVDNATMATPINRPANISMGGLVTFTNPELFAIKTSTQPGRCFNNLDTNCNSDADCGGMRCVLFQDYLGVRGTIVSVPQDTGTCSMP